MRAIKNKIMGHKPLVEKDMHGSLVAFCYYYLHCNLQSLAAFAEAQGPVVAWMLHVHSGNN